MSHPFFKNSGPILISEISKYLDIKINNLKVDKEILDIKDLAIDDPLDLEQRINLIPGVLDNGLFANCKPQKVIVGKD